MTAKDDFDRHGDALVLFDGFAEFRRLGDLQTDIEADGDEGEAGDEGNAPSVVEEILVAHRFRQDEEEAGGKDEADRRAELREHGVPAALAGGSIFGGEQDGAAPFAAEAEALTEAAKRQQ